MAWASSPTRIRHFPARTPSRMNVAACAAVTGALSRNISPNLHEVPDVVIRDTVGRQAATRQLLPRFGDVDPEDLTAVENDVGADVAGHHHRDVYVGRVVPEVLDERLGEPLHRELRR